MHKFARIACCPPETGVRWLRIVPEQSPDGGVFVLIYSTLAEPYQFDHWFESLEVAVAQCEAMYGGEARRMGRGTCFARPGN